MNPMGSWLGKILTPLVFLLVFQGSSQALDVTLKWDPNTEENLAGYIVYYDTDSGAPYSPVETEYADQYSIGGEQTWIVGPAAPPIWVGTGITEISFKVPNNDKDYFYGESL